MVPAHPPQKRQKKKNWQSPPFLTFAFFTGCGMQGVAVETPLAAFAVLALRVAQALEAPPADVVTHSQRVRVHVAVAFAPLTWASRTGLS